MSAEFPIQAALFARLADIGVRVVDVEPQAADGGSSANFPYIEIGEVVMTPLDTYTDLGHNFVARIHTRTRGGGRAAAKLLQGEIYSLLHRHALAVQGFHCLTLHREYSECTRAPDGSFHGVCEYRGLIDAA